MGDTPGSGCSLSGAGNDAADCEGCSAQRIRGPATASPVPVVQSEHGHQGGQAAKRWHAPDSLRYLLHGWWVRLLPDSLLRGRVQGDESLLHRLQSSGWCQEVSDVTGLIARFLESLRSTLVQAGACLAHRP